jgi:parallel beta-helix repeat protein
MKKTLLLLSLVLTMPALAENRLINIAPENFEADLNEALESMTGPTTITMPAGTFKLSNELLIDRPGLTLKGQGMDKTILSFKEQKAGPQGVLATKDQITFEDFAVEDSFGNAIKVIGAKHVTFRRVRISWTRGPSVKNGAYGLYPVLSEHVLIEGCEVSDASDAGIYVGQSKNIIVRGNHAHHNVAGIEIENSDDADVYSNLVEYNTAGILIFNLPDLVKKDGTGTRIYGNMIRENNHDNYSMKGTIINLVPKGMGVFILSARGTEIFDNDIEWHALAGIAISHYAISGRTIRDPSYDPMPKRIYVHNNRFKSRRMALPDGTQMNFIIKFIAGPSPKDVVYDGIDDGSYNGEPPTAENRICLGENTSNRGSFTYANLHLDNQRPYIPLPGGPVTRSKAPHDCSYPSRATVVLPQAPELPVIPTPSRDEVQRVCKSQGTGVNWKAFDYDCPDLADYRLFQDPSDPTQNAVTGVKYELNNQLFTDYALKDRFIFLPPGKKMNYREKFALDMPQGTLITKTFSVEEPDMAHPTLIETRLLIHRKGGWVALNYTWENGTARLNRAGFVKKMKVQLQAKVVDIDYHVPNLRQCSSCHFVNERMTPIGPAAKFLNRPSPHNPSENQLKAWDAKGMLAGLEGVTLSQAIAWEDATHTVDERAKAYLEINCAHCHNPKGNARNTGLFLTADRESNSVEMGHCKTPVAAGIGTGGRSFDIVPGYPDKSILMHRLESSHLAVKMPQLGRSIPHEEGNTLIRTWIEEMPKSNCK